MDDPCPNPEHPIAIGQRIQSLLGQLGQTPSWLADNAGLERSTITRVLKGDRNPTAETLSEIAPVLGVSLEELAAGTDAAQRVQDAQNLVSREHYEAAVRQVIEFERKAADLSTRLREADEAARIERERRKDLAAQLERQQQDLEEARTRALIHEQEAHRYRVALERAVADVARLQTQVRELGALVDDGRKTGKVAAILAGVAAVASVAAYLASDSAEAPSSPTTQPKRADARKSSRRRRHGKVQ